MNEEVSASRRGDETEQGLQQIAGDADDQSDGDGGLYQSQSHASQHASLGALAEDRHEQQQRNDSEVLEQQDGEAGTPVCEPRRRESEWSCTTIAVEESDRGAPITMAVRMS